MEATGIYYEQLAYHLNKLNKKVSVLLPNKVSHYSKSLNVKTKTDQVDAQIIAIMSCDPICFLGLHPHHCLKSCAQYVDYTKHFNMIKHKLSIG